MSIQALLVLSYWLRAWQDHKIQHGDLPWPFQTFFFEKEQPKRQSITFLCSDAGLYALTAIQCYLNKDLDGMKKSVLISWKYTATHQEEN